MHVAIIMDGNGRWAEQRGLPRRAGHRAGAKSARRVIEAAARSSVDCLTLYAFSSDNWSRPRDEVSHLMHLLKRYLQSEISRCVENDIRLNIIGRRDRLKPELVTIIERAESLTAAGKRMLLRIAVDYSARDALAKSAHRATSDCCCPQHGTRHNSKPGTKRSTESSSPRDTESGTDRGTDRACFENALAEHMHSAVPVRDVDLLIRSGGERRLSDFLLWECAYAELAFVDTYWPDFGEHEFEAALRDFDRRERRFGGIPAQSHSVGARAEPRGSG
jgi:undecaprenyl diphosphate synthase